MNMQLIQKIEKPILKNVREKGQLKEQAIQANTLNNRQLRSEKKPELVVLKKKINHVSIEEHPLDEGVGNSGWQVSDIWRDVRFDDL